MNSYPSYINYDQYSIAVRSLVGRQLPYYDDVAGVNWDIEVFAVDRLVANDGYRLILTDYATIELSVLDLMKGLDHVLTRINNTYKTKMDNYGEYIE